MWHRNKYFIGQCVEWNATDSRPAGEGVVESIYLSMGERLTYRVQRHCATPKGNLYELLSEVEIAPAVSPI